MSGAATPRRTSMPRSIFTRPSIPSSVRKSGARTGYGATSTKSCSKAIEPRLFSQSTGGFFELSAIGAALSRAQQSSLRRWLGYLFALAPRRHQHGSQQRDQQHSSHHGERGIHGNPHPPLGDH